jgi:hypothetical protein
MKLWLCGQAKGDYETGADRWEFQGIFSSEEKAINACLAENYFIYPVELDKEYPQESVIPEDGVYPKWVAKWGKVH